MALADLSVQAVGPVSPCVRFAAMLAVSIFKASGVDLDIGLSISEVLSTLPNPNVAAINPFTGPSKFAVPVKVGLLIGAYLAS